MSDQTSEDAHTGLASCFELTSGSHHCSAVIKVIGIGGGGCNAAEHMWRQSPSGIDFLCANTDAQALKLLSSPILQLGQEGLGAGANPEVGKQATESEIEAIQDFLNKTDLLFVSSGMGGGTGTGGAPVVARLAKERGILTVAVVTLPFSMEGRQRMYLAEQGIAELKKYVHALIIVPNDKLISTLGKNVSLKTAFERANEVLASAVIGIAELITLPGLINVDFADVKTVMSQPGSAMIGIGYASGDSRARLAAEMAVDSPLLQQIKLSGAKGILVNIATGHDMSMAEFEEVCTTIDRFISNQDAIVVIGAVFNPVLGDQLRVTVLATGLDDDIRGGTMASLSRTTPRRAPETSRQPMPAAPVLGSHLDIPAFLRRQKTDS
jgi:cell division protein FtsZ